MLAGEPLFVCQYRMAPGHWQIVKYAPTAPARGRLPHLRAGDAPPELIDIAVRGAADRRGFYGVDTQTDHGFIVMEVNDNPNSSTASRTSRQGRDRTRLLKWSIERLSSRQSSPCLGAVKSSAMASRATALAFQFDLETDLDKPYVGEDGTMSLTVRDMISTKTR